MIPKLIKPSFFISPPLLNLKNYPINQNLGYSTSPIKFVQDKLEKTINAHN